MALYDDIDFYKHYYQHGTATTCIYEIILPDALAKIF